jgi:AmmeMemoRadiSam system protein A
VVGYGAWAFSSELDATDMPLGEEHRQELLRISAATVQRAAAGKPFPKVTVGSFAAALQRPGASFVTLTKNGRLRGCLGSLKAYRPLVVDVAERGYASTIKDPRFKPVTAAELPGMQMEVAVLTAAKPMRFASETELVNQLRPGIDGLIVRDQGKGATFLPKVWDQISAPILFLNRLKQKAGLETGHWSDSFQAWRYETVRFAATLPNSR